MAAGDLILSDGWNSLSLNGWNNIEYASASASHDRIGSGGGLYFTRTHTYFSAYPRITSSNFGNLTEFLFGFAAKVEALGDVIFFLTFLDSAETSYQSAIGIGADGKIRMGRRSNTTWTNILGTSTSSFNPGRWYWIDGKIKIHNTTGYIELRVDGNVEISMTTSLDTADYSSYANMITLNHSSQNSYSELYMDDLFLFDNTGDTMSYPGDLRVLDLVPTSDGTLAQWAPSTGSDDYAMVDELPPSDTDYVYTNTTGDVELFNFTNLPSNAIAVYGLTYVTRAYKNNAGIKTVRNLMRQSAANYERTGSDFNPSLSASTYFFSEVVNPSTTLAYTVDEINNNEFGFKLES